ncbi:MAG: metallophosphoesterase family protein [Propionibacteriaceae bacterium]|nr:metallophosphoesterase family protein [Propionibacteriaceae bacterium]
MTKWFKRIVTVAAGCFAYGVFIERDAFKVRRVSVPILPDGASDIRILHFSDLHLLKTNRSRIKFIATLAGLEPDLVVGTGDFIAEPDAVPALTRALGRLIDVPGVFVLGSADYEMPTFRNPFSYLRSTTTRERTKTESSNFSEELTAALSAGAWENVADRRVEIAVQGSRLEFRGTDDAHLALDNYENVAGRAAAGVIPIGVTHAPYERVLKAMASDRLRLVFAGHTHGGQVCVPFYGALTTNCDLNPKYAKGLSRLRGGSNASYLHVSAGLGTSPTAAFRFACPPEVSLVTLTAKTRKNQHR